MDPLPDLEHASREELIALVRSLHALVGSLTERVRVLEEQIGKGGPGRTMPGTKPTEVPAKPPRPRKPRGRACVRRRSSPTQTVTHAPPTCPDCGTPLAGGWLQRTRDVLDVVLPRPRSPNIVCSLGPVRSVPSGSSPVPT